MNSREIHFETIGSTHEFAMKNSDEFPHLTVITADYQTGGRGRHGRSWLSPRDSSALISIIIKPDMEPDKAPQISVLTAVAALKTLCQFGTKPSIKWPNDILLRGVKIAGLLANASLKENRLDFIVASIGINVNQTQVEMSQIDQPATSLLIETGRKHDIARIRESFVSAFTELYETLKAHGFGPIFKEWKKNLAYIGNGVLLDLGGQVIEGTFLGAEEDASLIIETGDGNIRHFASGEIVRVRTNAERT